MYCTGPRRLSVSAWSARVQPSVAQNLIYLVKTASFTDRMRRIPSASLGSPWTRWRERQVGGTPYVTKRISGLPGSPSRVVFARCPLYAQKRTYGNVTRLSLQIGHNIESGAANSALRPNSNRVATALNSIRSNGHQQAGRLEKRLSRRKVTR